MLTRITAAAIAAFVITVAPAAAATCDSLLSLKLTNVTVTMAEEVVAGAFMPPAARGGGGGRGGPSFADLPAFCRVAATLKPTAESDIKIELWMPAADWNGKFQAVGNGGWNGNIDTNALATGLRRGYATASTDTGHDGGGGPWMQNREKLIDYGHRAVHEMTVTAKALINAFYGNAPRFSYFNGCSAGGRQGLKAAQMYPADFDGIVAGAPARQRDRPRGLRHLDRAEQPEGRRRATSRRRSTRAIHNAVLEGVRRARRRHRSPDREPARVQVRSAGARVQGGRRGDMPDAGAGRDRHARCITPLVKPQTQAA